LIGLSFCLVFAVTYRLNQSYLLEAAALGQVAVAGHTLAPGTLLAAEDFVMEERPVFGLENDFCTDLSGLFEKGGWYAGMTGLGEGDILRPSRLAKEPGHGDPFLQHRDGEPKRLISVETDLVRSCANWLTPGTKADAWVYVEGKEGFDSRAEQLIGPQDDPCLKDLLIVDKKNKEAVPIDAQNDEEIKDPLPVVLTLMLDQKDEEKAKALIRYNEMGKIYFSPTSAED
jgi:hypothetical protein